MIRKVISGLVCILWINNARCEPPPNNQYGTPIGAPISSYGTPNYHANDNGHHEYGEPKAYEFGYQVKDEYTGNNYNRKEASDGNQVRGEYRVALPDGRTQIVTYWADWQTGFHADVRYEGEAHYPEQYNTYQGQGASNQYGAPNHGAGGGGFGQGGYNGGGAGFGQNYATNGGYGHGAPVSNSLAINEGLQGNYHGGYSSNGYSNGFAHRPRPSNEYGAP